MTWKQLAAAAAIGFALAILVSSSGGAAPPISLTTESAFAVVIPMTGYAPTALTLYCEDEDGMAIETLPVNRDELPLYEGQPYFAFDRPELRGSFCYATLTNDLAEEGQQESGPSDSSIALLGPPCYDLNWDWFVGAPDLTRLKHVLFTDVSQSQEVWERAADRREPFGTVGTEDLVGFRKRFGTRCE